MDAEFINLTLDNLSEEHLCCIIRTKKAHPGVEAKRAWLADRLGEGHVFRKLNAKECVFIEYAPLETAWVPVVGENYLYIYCLWVLAKGHGYGSSLMEYCIADAKAKGKSGICMLGSTKQKSWLSDQSFAEKFGFTTVDTAGEYELLALSFDGTHPQFAPNAKKQSIPDTGLTVYYGRSEERRVGKECRFIHVESLSQAKSLPCVFNNWAVFFNGKFITVNQIDPTALKKIIGRLS